MSRISQILLFIKKELSIRGSTPEELINDYDRVKSGYISVDALNRAFNSYNVHLRNQDFQELMIDLSENGNVSVRKFLNSIRNVSDDSTSSKTNKPKSSEALLQLSQYLSIHQMTLRDALRPFDKLNRGTVTTDDFVRAFDSSVQAQLIANDYKDQYSSNVRYFQIERDLSVIDASKEQKKELPPPVVETVIAQLSTRNYPIRLIFEQFDQPAKTGCINRRAVPSVFEQTELLLTPNDLKEIDNYYTKQGQFYYIPFVQQIEERIKEKEVSKNIIYRSKKGEIIDTNILMEQIRKSFYNRRVNVSELFYYAVDGKCSRYKFLKTLGTNQRELNNDELNAIADRFDLNNGETDVQSFLSFFDFRRTTTTLNQAINTDNVLEKIREILLSKRVCLRRQCELYDRFGEGKIALAQMLVSFQKCGVQFNVGEYEAIVDRFSPEKGFVDYIQISQIVDNLELYKSQQIRATEEENYTDIIKDRDQNNISSTSLSSATLSSTRRPISKPPPQAVFRIVAKIAEVTRNMEIFLRDEFEARDKARHGVVNQDDFVRVVSLTNVNFPRNELSSVFMYYSDNTNFFDYNAFCRDVERYIQESNIRSRSDFVDENESQVFIQAIRKYRAYLVSRRLESEDLFRRYDSSGAGFIQMENLAPALGSANIHMSKNELQALLDAFSDSVIEGRFMYKKLDARSRKEKMNPTVIRSYLNPEFAHEEEIRELQGVLTEIREKLHVRRKNAFMLFGNCPTRSISPKLFVDKLLDAGIILIHSQANALVNKYTNGDMMNFEWEPFCTDCEKCTLIGCHSYAH